MKRITTDQKTLGLVAAVMFPAFPAVAQLPPWDAFDDAQSTSTCEVVNASDTELVVLRTTGELTIITGRDVTLADSFVNDLGDVFIGNDQFGFISYATDGDGFRTLWWTSLTGRVIDIDGLTLEIRETNTFPSDFRNVPCGVCDSGLWDVRADCDDVLPPVTIRICGNDVVIATILSVGGLLAMAFPVRLRRKTVVLPATKIQY